MAKIKVSAEYNIVKIIESAGANAKDAHYRRGELHINGITQQALENALAAYDDAAQGLPNPEAMKTLKETETLATVARKLEDLIDHIENGAPLSQQAKSWAQLRKTERSKL